MMGSKERAFAPLPAVTLDDLVPADHFYRLSWPKSLSGRPRRYTARAWQLHSPPFVLHRSRRREPASASFLNRGIDNAASGGE